MRSPALESAIERLGGWRSAGESYANRGGELLDLDEYVQTCLEELHWREYGKPPFFGPDERPSRDDMVWALRGITHNFEDDLLGDDLRIIHAALTETAA